MAAAATPPTYSQPIALYATVHAHRVRTAGNDAVYLRLSVADKEAHYQQDKRIKRLMDKLAGHIRQEMRQPRPFQDLTQAMLDVVWKMRFHALKQLNTDGLELDAIYEEIYEDLNSTPIDASKSIRYLMSTSETSLIILEKLQSSFLNELDITKEKISDTSENIDIENIPSLAKILGDLKAVAKRDRHQAEIMRFFQGWTRHSLSAEAGLVAALWVQSGELALTELQQYLLAEAIATQTDALIKLAKSVEMPGSEAFVTRDEFLLELAEANTAPPRRTTYTTLDHLFAD